MVNVRITRTAQPRRSVLYTSIARIVSRDGQWLSLIDTAEEYVVTIGLGPYCSGGAIDLQLDEDGAVT